MDAMNTPSMALSISTMQKLKVAAKYGIFVSPAIDNWCFIIDFQELLPHHTALRNNLLETLSQAFEHAFYFTKSHPPEQL